MKEGSVKKLDAESMALNVIIGMLKEQAKLLLNIQSQLELLQQKSSVYKIDDLMKEWTTNDEVIKLFGVSRRTLQNWRSNGTLPFTPIHGKIYYKTEVIKKLLDDNYTG